MVAQMDWDNVFHCLSNFNLNSTKWKWKWSRSVVSNSLRPVDCSPPSSSIHGILQARVLEWVAISFSRGSSWPRIEPGSPAFQADALTSQPPGKPQKKEKWKAKEKRKDIPIWIQKSKEKQVETRKPSSVINENKQRKTIEWERIKISSRKLEIPREHFMQRWSQ